MKISKQQYESALKLIEAYKRQTNNEIIGEGGVLNAGQFAALLSVKHAPDVGDFVVIPTRDTMSSYREREQMEYEQVVCTGYCGNDEFWGKNSIGQEREWSDSNFVVVGSAKDLFELDFSGVYLPDPLTQQP